MASSSLADLLSALAPVDVQAVVAEGPYVHLVLAGLATSSSSSSSSDKESGGDHSRDCNDQHKQHKQQLCLGNGFQTDSTHIAAASLFSATPIDHESLTALAGKSHIAPQVWTDALVGHLHRLLMETVVPVRAGVLLHDVRLMSFLTAYARLPRSVATYAWVDACSHHHHHHSGLNGSDITTTGTTTTTTTTTMDMSLVLHASVVSFLTDCLCTDSQHSVGQETILGLVLQCADRNHAVCIDVMAQIIKSGLVAFNRFSRTVQSKPCIHSPSRPHLPLSHNPDMMLADMKHCQRLLGWILQCAGKPGFDVVAKSLCRLVYLEQVHPVTDQMFIETCCWVTDSLLCSHKSADRINADQYFGFMRSVCQLMVCDTHWDCLMDAAGKGKIAVELFLGSLHEWVELDLQNHTKESLCKGIELSILNRHERGLCVFTCSLSIALRSDAQELIKCIRNLFQYGTCLLLKPEKDWTLHTLKTLCDVMPVLVIKHLAIAIRSEPFWTPLIDLIKARLDRMGETLGNRKGISETLSVDIVLQHFSRHGTVPTSLIDASIFHAPWYNKTFLPSLLRGGDGMDPMLRVRLIQVLRQADRIPRHVFDEVESQLSLPVSNTNDYDADILCNDMNTRECVAYQTDSVSKEQLRTMLDSANDAINKVRADILVMDSTEVKQPERLQAIVTIANQLQSMIPKLRDSIQSLYYPKASNRKVGIHWTTGDIILSAGSAVFPEETLYVDTVFTVLYRLYKEMALMKASDDEIVLSAAGESLLTSICFEPFLYPAVMVCLQSLLGPSPPPPCRTCVDETKMDFDPKLLGYLIESIQRQTTLCEKLAHKSGQWSRVWILRGSLLPGDDPMTERRGLFQALFARFASDACGLTLTRIGVACEWLHIRRAVIAKRVAGSGSIDVVRSGGFASVVASQLVLCRQRYSAVPSSTRGIDLCRRIDHAIGIETGHGCQDTTVDGYRSWIRFEATFPKALDWMNDLTRIEYIKTQTIAWFEAIHPSLCIIARQPSSPTTSGKEWLEAQTAVINRMVKAGLEELQKLAKDANDPQWLSSSAEQTEAGLLTTTIRNTRPELNLYISGFILVLCSFQHTPDQFLSIPPSQPDSSSSTDSWLWSIK
ncbi:hypothetical protein BASA81_005957 [Batrachochytrium salamandrivorans]|nr:hypothetical protein BASA81_005957 [Batrachochytrium salamandrivorans]